MPYCITLRSKTMEGSPAGMSAATAGRPITSGKSFSTRNAMPDQYAMSCAASARTMAQSSTLKQPCWRRRSRASRRPNNSQNSLRRKPCSRR